MLKEAIKEAATIEEASAAAAAELGVAAELIQYEILQTPQKKKLGLFGGSMARVRAYCAVTPASRAAEYLRDILSQLGGKNVVIDIQEEENGCVLKLSGDDLGFIIGRRGETLDSLQYLAGLVANRVDNAYYRVTLDIGNYREKREQSLTGLAKKMANQAARTGRKSSLEPMNPYERRIIHTAVQDVKGATSWSVGTEPNRHVVIGPSEDNPVRSRGGNGGNGGNRSGNNGSNGGSNRSNGGNGGNSGNRNRNTDNGRSNRPSDGERAPRNQAEGAAERPERPERGVRPERPERPDRSPRGSRSDTVERPEREVRQFVPRSNPLPTADGATPPSKTQSEKENSSALYGRIDL